MGRRRWWWWLSITCAPQLKRGVEYAHVHAKSSVLGLGVLGLGVLGLGVRKVGGVEEMGLRYRCAQALVGGGWRKGGKGVWSQPHPCVPTAPPPFL